MFWVEVTILWLWLSVHAWLFKKKEMWETEVSLHASAATESDGLHSELQPLLSACLHKHSYSSHVLKS